MDKNTIIGLILLFGLFMGFSFYNSSQNKKLQEQRAAEAMERMAEEYVAEQQMIASIDSISRNESTKTGETTPVDVQNNSKRKPFSSLSVEGENYLVETDLAKYSISKKGGYVSQVELKGVYRYSPDSLKHPLVLLEDEDACLNIDLMLRDQTVIKTQDYYFISSTTDTVLITGEESQQVSFKMYPTTIVADPVSGEEKEVIDNQSYIEYLYTFTPGNHKFDFDVHFVNMSSYLYPTNHNYTVGWNMKLINVEKSHEYEKNNTNLFYMDNLEDVDNLDEKKNDTKNFTSPLKWVAFKQQFFTSVIIADSQNFSSGELAVADPSAQEANVLRNMSANLDFEMNDLDNGTFDMSFYIGPNQYKLLKDNDLKLERMIPLGWGFFLLQWINRFAVIPFFNWLGTYGLSYGIIILIITVFLKMLLLPIAYKTYLSSARMRVLKPEIDEISARYPKQEDMAKKQQATMSLYKSAGVSPMSGCLPMLLQMPILFAMYRFFPAAYELRQEKFLWADDLSSYDSILDLGFSIPFYGDHISLFTLLMTVATFVYTWMNNKNMATGNDPSQKMMKNMMYIMPIMFLGIFNNLPSALTYYYLLVNLITFLQMWIFRVAVNDEKLHEKIKLNMKQPVKKSKWQARMEELAKQQQQMQKAQQKGKR